MNYKFLKSAIYVAILLVSNSIKGQEIDYKKISASEVKVYEKIQNSTFKDTLGCEIFKNPLFIDSETIVQTKVLVFKRNDDEFDPQLHLWYFYNNDWTELKGKKYFWGPNPSFDSSKNEKISKKLSKNEEVFKTKYKLLEEKLKSEYGEPVKKETKVDNESRFIEEIFWEDDEKVVGLQMRFARKLTEDPIVNLANFRVEIMITYK